MKKVNGHIGSDAAKTAALAYNEIRLEDAEFLFCQMDHDPRADMYHIVFDACTLRYECYIDAVTAEVWGMFSEPAETEPAVAFICA